MTLFVRFNTKVDCCELNTDRFLWQAGSPFFMECTESNITCQHYFWFKWLQWKPRLLSHSWVSQGFQHSKLPVYRTNHWKLSLCGIFQYHLKSVTATSLSGALREGVCVRNLTMKNLILIFFSSVLHLDNLWNFIGCLSWAFCCRGWNGLLDEANRWCGPEIFYFPLRNMKRWGKLESPLKESKHPDSLSVKTSTRCRSCSLNACFM